jgi:HD superfamily phosphohydrolase
MKIQDRVYGEIQITDPVIIDLINTKPFQRLKHISQDGASHFIQPQRNVTRYEHCIGAWYLSHKYNRPIEEQIASLLHDIPHTAFSHVIDFVVGDEKHEYHDRFTKEIIIKSEIPAVLKKHNVSLEKVLHKENFYLLDNDLPDISVDRFDYFLRDGIPMQLISKETVKLFLKSVKEKDDKFYFDDVAIASQFAILFMNFSRLIWLDPSSHGSFFLLSEAIKIGLKKKYLTKNDFFKTDNEVMQQLLDADDAQINALLMRLKPHKEFHYAAKEHAEFYGSNKPRFVDPWVMQNNELHMLSELIPNFKEYFSEYAKNFKNLGVIQE